VDYDAQKREQGLIKNAHVLEKYGIDSTTEVSELEKDNFCKLEARGLRKSLH
jgi:hypothetical protein